jgi:hypothetical protein
MTSPVSRYATPAIRSSKNIDLVHLIDKDTSPQKFDTLCEMQEIVLEKGESFRSITPLMYALSVGNMLLVDHIIDVGGKKLLEIGTEDGFSPLNQCLNRKCRDLPGAIKLIQLGADVNVVIPKGDNLPERNVLWTFVLEMSAVALKVQYITLKFLLSKGAVAIPELYQRGKQIVEYAENEMRAPLVAALSNDKMPLVLPLALAKLTASYVPVDEIVMNDEELEKEVAQVDALLDEIPRQVVKI